jgi:mono/diheme cytochrome c family protein
MKFSLCACALVLAVLTGSATGQQSIARGRQYYLHYCASCHGVDADGRGPMAHVLKTAPPDLRYLGERYGVPLPSGTIARFIDGRQYVAAHGPRDMPVWGRRFYDIWTAKQSREGDLEVQIREIVEYLNAIQVEPMPPEGPLQPKRKS